ncbi:MAG: HAMP domain-containing histidine kinase [Acetobacteraceae bacterium]|nr:HAMP domain-containing histidine kinase [Acetobacteraceae bacterium]
MTFPLPGSFGLFSAEVLLLAVVGCTVWFVGNLLMPQLPAAVVPGPVTAPMPDVHPADLDRITRFELGGTPIRGEKLDVASEIRWTLSALKPRAAFGLVRLEVAVQPGLALWLDQTACRKMLLDVVGQVMEAAPTGRVLVTAFLHGGRVQIGASNDSAVLSREAAASALRPVDAIVAFHGGSLEVDSRAGQGMTATIRLPRFTQAPAPATPAATVTAAPARPAIAEPLEASLQG